MDIKIKSLNVALPHDCLEHNGKPVLSGMVKLPVSEPTYLHPLGFDGDGQADTKHHGGPDKAVCVYAQEHYAYWEARWQRELPVAAFGENLTTEGLIEQDVHIGDIFHIGEAIVQVTQPRQPCFKLAARYKMPEVPLWMQETGYTGLYFRVLTPGLVHPGGTLERMKHDPAAVSIQYANEVMHHRRDGEEGIRRLLDVEALSASWRATFTKRLAGSTPNTNERLFGK
ncbi:MOSC domain-containing protein [Paenibacillus sp. MER TA 81-3]|uniref:MOSC domain-containing protein n=1 Tax=Paenibacillus sp. MER TA 81-3 TaxID=2939573 RepID=UPI00203C156C|nr:MOSC domain-containing protein [Paenibacillus sp. MER TA 81-3]MCM3338443.1 MOSC domain-containing protein [Paenibacillus sp. MER TA 81-3]